MQVFEHDGDNDRRLVVHADRTHSLRGFHHLDEDAGVTVTVVQQFGPSDAGNAALMALTAHAWPGAAVVAHVARPWKRGSDYQRAWSEMRRQVEVSTGVDIGDVLRGPGDAATAAALEPTKLPFDGGEAEPDEHRARNEVERLRTLLAKRQEMLDDARYELESATFKVLRRNEIRDGVLAELTTAQQQLERLRERSAG